MKKVVVSLLAILTVFSYSHQANAIESEFIRNNLSNTYQGTFKWHGAESTQDVFITIANLSVDSSGNVIAAGFGEYRDAKSDAKINIKIKISPKSLRFEMWEMNPQGKAELITDGSHVGIISKDLQVITAVWTTTNTGKQGDLLLKAD